MQNEQANEFRNFYSPTKLYLTIN